MSKQTTKKYWCLTITKTGRQPIVRLFGTRAKAIEFFQDAHDTDYDALRHQIRDELEAGQVQLTSELLILDNYGYIRVWDCEENNFRYTIDYFLHEVTAP